MGKIFSNLTNRHSVLVFAIFSANFMIRSTSWSEGMENNLNLTILENIFHNKMWWTMSTS